MQALRKLMRPSSTYLPYRYSTLNNKQVETPLQDWQYCKQISQQLKHRNIQKGFSLLLQSYLKEQVLDIQIYNSLFHQLHEHGFSHGYSEVLYLIYREHFQPHPLMLMWMNKLSTSQNQKLVEILKNDFQTIHQPFPIKKPRSKNSQKEHPSIKEAEQITQKKSRASRIQSQKQKNKAEVPPEVEYLDQSTLTPQEIIKMRMQYDFNKILSQFTQSGQFGKINLYDVQIQFNNEEEPQQGFNDDYEDEMDDEMEPQDMGLMGLDISKIKIGRVEFKINPPENDNNDDKKQ